jgi:biotin operon repressor
MAARWSEQEIEYLADQIGLLSYEELSKKLNRSKEAIKHHRCLMKLPMLRTGNYYSCTLLAKELGRSRASIRKYYRKGWLVGKQATWKALFGNQPFIFLEEHIVDFLRKFNYLFDWRKIPNLYFRNVVKGTQQ